MVSENMIAAQNLIIQANELVKREWDNDHNNKRAAGCYKALNAVSQVIAREGKDMTDGQYAFSRLLEAISWLSECYDLTFKEALGIGHANFYLNKQ